MPSLTSSTEPGSPVIGSREAQRLETRARLFDAAVAEMSRSGLAGADVSTIATKEHVMVELERAEEALIVAELDNGQTAPDDLTSILSMLVRHVRAAEQRLGPVVFRDMLGLHFSSARPVEDELRKHPLAEFLVSAIKKAQRAGRVPRDADAGELGVFFLTGLFALLATGGAAGDARDAMLDRYVVTIVQGMEKR
jgi:AcrR family transcriptional regulator